MKRLNWLLCVLMIVVCVVDMVACDDRVHELRRILPRNLLNGFSWDNVFRALRFIFSSFQEWAKNKSITFILQTIAANLNRWSTGLPKGFNTMSSQFIGFQLLSFDFNDHFVDIHFWSHVVWLWIWLCVCLSYIWTEAAHRK